jgi:putative SOS response-associated peptidase YedK
MCGRTVLTATPADLREAFGLDATPELVPRYNVTPSQDVATVRVLHAATGKGARTLQVMRWGLVPWWADSPKVGAKLALARAETVAITPAFRDAFKARRCLIVVDGFYEWKRAGGLARPPGRAKRAKGDHPSRPYLLRRPDAAPFALAGVWDRWTSADGEVLESCAIVTQQALPPVLAIHDRMPVVLPPEDWEAWLDPGGDVSGLLVPRPPCLVAVAVSTYVNDPRHDDPRCFEPPGLPQQGSLF